MKVRNYIFAVLICVFLFGPLSLLVVENGGIELPGWFTAKDSAYLSGGLAKANVEENLSIEGYASKALQTALENGIGNHIPIKAQIIYLNGTLQRRAIELSNTLFSWESYPAIFGSEYCYVPSQDRIVPIPQRMSEGLVQAFQDYTERLDAFAQAHPDMEFVTYFAPGWDTTLYSPLNDLMNDRISYEKVQEIVCGAVNSHESPSNTAYLFADYDGERGEAEYLADYYHFDHHWNNRGTARAYYQIAQSLDLPLQDVGTFFDIPDEPYSGAYARSALMNVGEPFVGVSNGLDSTVVNFVGKEWVMGEHVRYYTSSEPAKHYNAYTLYSETLEGATIITGNGDKNILLLSDSYGGALQYFLPLSCNSLIQGISVSANDKSTEVLEEILAGKDIDVVVFVAHSTNFSNMALVKPDFFTVE